MQRTLYRIKLFLLIPFFLIGLPVMGLSQDSDLKIVTTEYPPYSYTDENGKVAGVSTAIVKAILKKLGLDAPIYSYPWSRAYRTALEDKNVLIYTMVKTAEREKLFEWVGLIIEGASFLYSQKNREDIIINTLNDAKPYTIGVIRNAIRYDYLKKNGFTHLDEAGSSTANAQKLLRGWIDLWAVEELTAEYTLAKLGYDPQQYLKKQLPLGLEINGYLAFSKGSDPGLIQGFRRELENLKQSGEFASIINNSFQPKPEPAIDTN